MVSQFDQIGLVKLSELSFFLGWKLALGCLREIAQKGAQDGPTWTKKAQDRPKMVPGLRKILTSDLSKLPASCPKSAPKGLQDIPRWLQNGPKVQDGWPKMTPEGFMQSGPLGCPGCRAPEQIQQFLMKALHRETIAKQQIPRILFGDDSGRQDGPDVPLGWPNMTPRSLYLSPTLSISYSRATFARDSPYDPVTLFPGAARCNSMPAT